MLGKKHCQALDYLSQSVSGWAAVATHCHEYLFPTIDFAGNIPSYFIAILHTHTYRKELVSTASHHGKMRWEETTVHTSALPWQDCTCFDSFAELSMRSKAFMQLLLGKAKERSVIQSIELGLSLLSLLSSDASKTAQSRPIQAKRHPSSKTVRQIHIRLLTGRLP